MKEPGNNFMHDVTLHLGDCLEVMRDIPDASVDCVLTDPPYGTTACKWDSVIPFEPMWNELKRIAKPKAAICLFGSQPFTSALVMSNIRDFKYQWVWRKSNVTGFLNAKLQPLRCVEDVVVFAQGQTQYFPQMRRVPFRFVSRSGGYSGGKKGYGDHQPISSSNNGEEYPVNVLNTASEADNVHPTQKPVELLRYLIRTYTLEAETVLDFTMGSGSTGVACQLENRKFIGIERDENYFAIAEKRIAEVAKKEPLFMAA